MRPTRRHTNQLMLFSSARELQQITHGTADQPFYWDDRSDGRHNRDKGTPEDRADKEDQLKRMWGWKTKTSATTRRPGLPSLQEEAATAQAQGRMAAPVTLAHVDDGFSVWDGSYHLAGAAAVEERTGRPVWVPIQYDPDRTEKKPEDETP